MSFRTERKRSEKSAIEAKGMLSFLVILLSVSTHAQNLVSNGGFEDENICVEYKQNCAPEAWVANSFYDNYYYYTPGKAHDGTHFVGLAAGTAYKTPGTHYFIRTRLLCGLQAGHRYQLEFWVRSRHDILDSVGVYFSAGDFLYEKRNYKEIQPQLWAVNALDTLDADPNNWQKVRLMYTATGDEGYITIGSFNRKEWTFRNAPDMQRNYYFYLDAVSLVPLDKQEGLCPQADSVKADIYRENQRHEFLRRQVYINTKNPPPVKPLPKTANRPIPPKQHIDTLIIPDIFFATASYQLSPKSFGSLDSFARRLNTFQVDSVVIEGHTDSVGTLAYNEALSRNRAIAVKEYVEKKLPAGKIPFTTRSYAFLRPVRSNKTPAGRQQNRRVEIYVYRRE
ncbi:MAG: OmpA family protein [Niastella sp.]|nr:OmpA family protein [Niastella sp.]